MLSMRINDGRKGLGFGVGGEMEEAELEEGEACYYQEDEAGIEPDVALSSLSYIDEKIQHVLGHFQKDFEGGVSAEKLGAKFGGYGSFLPAHERSPSIRSHPRTPQKVQTYSTPKSPNNMPVEGGQNHQSLASGPHSIRHASVSTNAHLSSTVPCVDNSSKKGSTPVCDYANNRSVNATDQKMLKLRIKVCSNNVSARKNAAIYSGLGLISPSSSLEDSPDVSGGSSPESNESPLTIIRSMVSFLVAGEYLLSPLPDCLLHPTEEERLLTGKKPGTVQKGSQVLPTMLGDEPLSFRERKGYEERKTKSVEKNGNVMEMQSGNGKNSGNDMSDHRKKEIDIETPGRRELVSNAVKLPLLSSSKGISDKMERPINSDTVRGPYRAFDLCREVNKGDIKDRTFSSEDLVKEEVFESATSIDPGTVSKSGNELVLLKERPSLKSSSAVKVQEEKRTSAQKDISLDPLKQGRGKSEKSSNTCTVDSDRLKGRTDYNSGSEDPYAQMATHRAISYELNVEKTSQRKEGKKKKKGNQSNGNSAVELPKDCSNVIKDRKSSQSQDSSGNRSDTLKSSKEPGKIISKECHKISLGVTKVKQIDNRINSMEMNFTDKLKDSKLDSEKDTHSFVEKSKERLGAKKVENPSTSEVYANNSSAAPLTSNVQTADAVIAPMLPVVIEENWVQCDKCQKWRLLPYGTNPNLFMGKKWLCNMLNWLPGMNKCSISEEETTKALNALYLLVPERQNNVQGQYDGAASGNVSADVHHPDQSHKSSLVMPGSGRKKHGPKDASSAFGSSTLAAPPNSIKKDQQSSIKSRNSTDASQYPLESKLIDNASFPDTSKSTDFAIDKHHRKQKVKQKVLESQLDEGDYTYQSNKHSKNKSKREVDRDHDFITSKKIKKEGFHCNYEDWQSDCDVTGKEIPNSSNDLLTKVTGKDPQKHNGYSSSKDSKGNARENSQSSEKKPKGQLQVSLDGEYKAQFMASDMGRSDKTDFAAKKRKLRELQQSSGSVSVRDEIRVKDEISETELQREKKVRPLKSDEKESSASKADGITEKKGGATKILIPGYRDSIADGMKEESRGVNKAQVHSVSQRTRDGMDLSKREPGYAAQTSTAATSSSSKVSGSRKNKGNLPEVKDSPVESVSSSPLRGSNVDKLTTAARRNILGKDDTTNLCFPVGGGSPRRCSDGETDGRSDRSGTVKKEKASLEFQTDVGSSLLHEYQDGFADQTSSRKFKSKKLLNSFGGQGNSLSEFENANAVNNADTAVQHNPYLIEEQGMNPDHDSEKPHNCYQINGSGERKLGKDSSSLPRGKHAKFDFDKDNVKVSDSCSEQEELHPTKSFGPAGSCQYKAEFESRDHSPYRDNLRNGKYNIQKTSNINSDKDNNYLVKKDSTKKQPVEGQRDGLSNLVTQGSPLQIKHHTDLNSGGKKMDKKDGKYNLQQNLPETMPRDNERSSDLFLSDGTDRAAMVSGRVKSQSFHPGEKQELDGKGSRPDTFPVDAPVAGTMKVPKQPNGALHSSVRKPTPNGLVCRDIGAPSQLIKDYGQAAAKVLKEAKDLKHTANRLKRGGGELESTNLFFRAALKFLHGASLLELCSSENAKNGETTQSMKYYTDTARLCMFCAHEYEKCKEMAAASLAYKCVEVAYMRVIFSKRPCATRDRCKLQKALLTAAQGESPSSSASDVDDLNNQATLDKMALDKGTSSPQNAGNHIIPASSRPSYTRVLNYVEDINSAMEASRKSENAFAAAKVILKEVRYRPEDISSVRSVLDFNFHDVEGLIHLVRLAMEAICC